jgi:hypothetical protein
MVNVDDVPPPTDPPRALNRATFGFHGHVYPDPKNQFAEDAVNV